MRDCWVSMWLPVAPLPSIPSCQGCFIPADGCLSSARVTSSSWHHVSRESLRGILFLQRGCFRLQRGSKIPAIFWDSFTSTDQSEAAGTLGFLRIPPCWVFLMWPQGFFGMLQWGSWQEWNSYPLPPSPLLLLGSWCRAGGRDPANLHIKSQPEMPRVLIGKRHPTAVNYRTNIPHRLITLNRNRIDFSSGLPSSSSSSLAVDYWFIEWLTFIRVDLFSFEPLGPDWMRLGLIIDYYLRIPKRISWNVMESTWTSSMVNW